MEFDMKDLLDVVRQATGNKHFTAKNGNEYAIDGDGDVELLTDPLIDEPLRLNQLSGLIDWLSAEGKYVQSYNKQHLTQLMIHVVSPTEVQVIGGLDNSGARPIFATVDAVVDVLPIGRFLSQEEMVILLQSSFQHDKKREDKDGRDERDIVLQVVSNLRSSDVQQQTDDGISQTVQINSGVATAANVKVPNPVTLVPFRTFQEIEQPASKFIFRMREGMESALFSADNSQWKVEAKQRIKDYLIKAQQDKFGEIKYSVIA